MKILVADDNPVARTVLRAFLEKSEYQPCLYEDGPEALQALLQADAPQIAILDWMMPGMSGVEVCTKLRAANLPIRPYVILLTAKTDKSDIASGLDAGADEFITKPFNQIEMRARLRVAQRMIKFQIELQEHVEQLEAMVQRHHLLSEIIAQRNDATPVGEPLAITENPYAEIHSLELDQTQLSNTDITEALRQSLYDLSWEEQAVLHLGEGARQQANQSIAWAGLFIPQASQWIDLLLETDQKLVFALFEKSMRRRPHDDREALNYFAELLTLVVEKCKALLSTRACTTVFPFLPSSRKLGGLSKQVPVPSDADTYSITVAAGTVRLTIARTASPTKNKSAGQLNSSDILADSFQPSEDCTIPLLNQGTILNDRFIERIAAHSQGKLINLKVPVISQTPITSYFNPEI